MTEKDINTILSAIGELRTDMDRGFKAVDSQLRRINGDLKTAAHERAQIKAVIVENAEGLHIRINEVERNLTEAIDAHTSDPLVHNR